MENELVQRKTHFHYNITMKEYHTLYSASLYKSFIAAYLDSNQLQRILDVI